MVIYVELVEFIIRCYVMFRVCLFVFGATAPSGPGPPHSRGV